MKNTPKSTCDKAMPFNFSSRKSYLSAQCYSILSCSGCGHAGREAKATYLRHHECAGRNWPHREGDQEHHTLDVRTHPLVVQLVVYCETVICFVVKT